MKRFIVFCMAVAVALAQAGAAPEEGKKERPTAAQLLKACREGLPLNQASLNGRLIVRKPRGFIKTESRFRLEIDWGAEPAVATCTLYDAKGTTIVERVVMTRPRLGDAVIQRFAGNPLKEQLAPSLASRVADTDLTWLDLTLDFLWWPEPVYDNGPAVDRSVLGRACEVVLAAPPKPIPGCAAVRMWIDKQTGFLMKAEELGTLGETTRYFWVQKVKKFADERWMIRLLKARARESAYETQLLVDALDDEVFSDRLDSE